MSTCFDRLLCSAAVLGGPHPSCPDGFSQKIHHSLNGKMTYTPQALVPYNTATQLAEVFQRNVPKIVELGLEIGRLQAELRSTFFNSTTFDIGLRSHSQNYTLDQGSLQQIKHQMKCEAWKAIIDKLGLRKLMSTSRARQMDEQLGIGSSNYDRQKLAAVPEITVEGVTGVLQGFVSSIDEFISEAISEEYEWWKPHSARAAEFKTNEKHSEQGFKLGRKVIKTWVVERGYGRGWRIRYGSEQHGRALDNIFHILDGKGPVEGYESPLLSAMGQSPDGAGETDYFAFKCHKNGNLHLEFLRQDLLDEFNRRAGRNRLGR